MPVRSTRREAVATLEGQHHHAPGLSGFASLLLFQGVHENGAMLDHSWDEAMGLIIPVSI